MDEFRPKQTNPYSSQPEPVQQVNFSPIPTPAPSADPEPELDFLAPPEPITVSYAPPTQVQTSNQNQTMDAVTKPRSKGIPKVLIIAPLALLLLSSLTGGGWLLYKRQVAQYESQIKTAKDEVASVKSSKFGSTNGQGLSLAGSTGEVAGASDDASTVDGSVYTGQVALRDTQVLFEMYVNTNVTGKIDSVWVNYGGNQESLTNQTEKTTEGLSKEQEGFVQVIALGNLSDFEAGSSYMYRTSVKAEDGKVYKSGYSIFTVPAAQNSPAESSTGSGL